MAKKKKAGGQPEKKNKNLIIIIAVIAVVAAVVVAMQMKSSSDGTSGTVSAVDEQALRKGETRQTLSPSQFSDPFVAAMYQVARDIPHVLDSVKCYCYCERDPFNHKSLLSCYVDTHAAG